MKRISVQDLEAHLSGAIAAEEAGETWLVTRRNHAVAQLGPVFPARVHVGVRQAAFTGTPAVTRGANGRYLAALLDVRCDR